MADPFDDRAYMTALQDFERATLRVSAETYTTLEGLIVIVVNGDGISVAVKGELDNTSQANVLVELAKSFGCEVQIDVEEDPVH